MNRKVGTLCGLLAVLILAFAGYLGLSAWTEAKEAQEAEGTSFSVLDLDSSAIVRMAYQSEGAELALVRGEDTDIWEYESDRAFPLKQSEPEAMLDALAGLSASQQFEGETLSDYGLDAPSQTVSFTLEDGTETLLTLGDENAVTGGYYLQVNGGSTVYLVDGTLGDAFSATLDDLLQMETMPTVTAPLSLSVSNELGSFTVTHTDDPGSEFYTDSYEWFLGSRPMETSLVTGIKSKLLGLAWNECVEYNASDLSLYGLDSPAASIALTYEGSDGEETVTLLVGSAAGDGYYAKLDGSVMVYTISTDVAEAFLALDEEDLYAVNACSFDWETVDSIIITTADGTQTLNLNYEVVTDEDGTSSTSVSYTLDGAECDSGLVNSWLTGLNNLTAEGYPQTGTTVGAAVTLTFTRNAVGYDTVTLTAVSTENGQYLVGVNGENWGLIAQDTLDSLLEELADLPTE